MRGSSITLLFVAIGLSAQTTPELKSPDEVLKVQPFRQWGVKKPQPHAFLVTPKPNHDPWIPVAPKGACSIPLITIKPEAVDQAMAIPTPKSSSNMPQVVGPAPPCKDWPLK